MVGARDVTRRARGSLFLASVIAVWSLIQSVSVSMSVSHAPAVWWPLHATARSANEMYIATQPGISWQSHCALYATEIVSTISHIYETFNAFKFSFVIDWPSPFFPLSTIAIISAIILRQFRPSVRHTCASRVKLLKPAHLITRINCTLSSSHHLRL